MADNMDLFEEEIEEIGEFSELDMDLFHDVLDHTREVVSGLGNSISPVAVVDIIEGAVGHLVYQGQSEEKMVTVEEAVARAVSNLHLIDEMEEMDAMLEDNPYALSDEIDTGKVRQ